MLANVKYGDFGVYYPTRQQNATCNQNTSCSMEIQNKTEKLAVKF